MTIDVVKGTVIVAIVIIHMLTLRGEGMEVTSDPNPVLLFGYMCLPLFFIISGYFFRPERTFAQNMGKRLAILLTALVACYLVLPLVLMGYLAAIGQPTDFDFYLGHLYTIFGHYEMFQPYDYLPGCKGILWIYVGYYFIQTMLVAFIAFYLIAGRVLDDWRKLLASVVVLVTITFVFVQFCRRPPLFLDLASLACAFMLIGAYAGRRRLVERMESGGWRTKRYWVSFIACILIGAVMIGLFPPIMAMQDTRLGYNGGWSAYSFFIEGVACGYVGLVIMSWLAKIPYVSGLFGSFGRHTLGILLLHIFVAKVIVAPFYRLEEGTYFPMMPIDFTLAVAVLTLAVCFVLCVLGNKAIARMRSQRNDVAG